MKKTGMIIWLPLTVVFFISTAFISLEISPTQNPVQEEGFAIPEEVNLILKNSCFGCHNHGSTSEKAKKKLMIDQLSELSKTKLVAALDGINEVLVEEEMPPEKFLAEYPDKALSKDEAKMLKEWTESTMNELMK